MARKVRSEIEIEAPLEYVWEILTDLGGYAAWNPFTPRAESTLRVGDPIHLDVRLTGEKISRSVDTITAMEPGKALCWHMKVGASFLLVAERCQTLVALDGDRTLYRSEEHTTGVLAPLLMLLYGAAMQRGFDDCAAGLKRHAES
ncbi:MAG: SRPBCC domain-containing protein [Deltaproteobacteria bacterium]|nr:SRPBCC domain-containing protein [Deltaproteobacteria bacterium]